MYNNLTHPEITKSFVNVHNSASNFIQSQSPSTFQTLVLALQHCNNTLKKFDTGIPVVIDVESTIESQYTKESTTTSEPTPLATTTPIPST